MERRAKGFAMEADDETWALMRHVRAIAGDPAVDEAYGRALKKWPSGVMSRTLELKLLTLFKAELRQALSDHEASKGPSQ